MFGNDERIEAAFHAAVKASKVELERCYHDPKVWMTQATVIFIGLLKVFCLVVACCCVAFIAGLPLRGGAVVALILIPAIAVWYPRFFIHNVFMDKCSAVFDAELDKNLKRGS